MAKLTGPERHEIHLRIARGVNKTLKAFGEHAQPMRKLRGGLPPNFRTPHPSTVLTVRGPKKQGKSVLV
jgi:hypothetical protein